MPFYPEHITAPTHIFRRLRRARQQNIAARVATPPNSDTPEHQPDKIRTTLDATIRPVGRGRYRQLAWAPGEPHHTRSDFTSATAAEFDLGAATSLLYFAQHTDLHICDAQAEARMVAGQAFAWFHPGSDAGHRPNETMATHVFDQLIRATNNLANSPLSGAPLAFCAQTGDHTDNRTNAEVTWWLQILAGEIVTPNTGAPDRYEGVQRSGWAAVWNPDHAGNDRPQRHGFPHLPGVLDAAIAPFQTEGLQAPWLGLQGNHDQIYLGTFGRSKGLRFELVEDMLHGSGLAPVTGSALVRAALLASVTHGNSTRWRHKQQRRGVLTVTPDAPARRVVAEHAFRERIAAAPNPPLNAPELVGEREWWSRPAGQHIQLIALDTRNHTAGDEGGIGPQQASWLEGELARHHRRFLAPDGQWVDNDGVDRLIVILSHHNSSVLDNARNDRTDPGRPIDGDELIALLARFPNVVLWCNGHSHQHRVVAHHRDGTIGGGFWEVTNASVASFPQQGRTYELFVENDGTVSIATTVFDHAAPPSSQTTSPGKWTARELASLSRELAANDDRWDDPMNMLGTREDRNVVLPIPTPFSFLASTHSKRDLS